MHDPRSALLQHNCGHWQGLFIRMGADGLEDTRFSTTLDVSEQSGLIQTSLTYLESGQQRSMNFRELPHTMQVSATGGWSLGPGSITPFGWVGEMCVVSGTQRRRIVVRHGPSGLDQVVYVIETMGIHPPSPPQAPVQCQIEDLGTWRIWRPEPDVELLLDARHRVSGEATLCGMRWVEPNGDQQQIVRRYDSNGMLLTLTSSWP